MPPIEARFSFPEQQIKDQKIFARDSQKVSKTFNDVRVTILGEEHGGKAIIKRHSQKKPKEINLNTGQIQEKKYTVIAKGGIKTDIKVRFVGK